MSPIARLPGTGGALTLDGHTIGQFALLATARHGAFFRVLVLHEARRLRGQRRTIAVGDNVAHSP